ncbi:MAG: hypothetical protein Q4F56_01160, partial [Candidatus Saccharibacteria bacterium]|nr:hypothetical protein [Candidatus Saccharibacteria bacterium]
MEQNSGGTPNPLNPSGRPAEPVAPDVVPGVAPMAAPKVAPTEVLKAAPKAVPKMAPRPVSTTASKIAPATAPKVAPNGPTEAMGVVTDLSGNTIEQETLDPMNRPMEKAPLPEAPQPRKKKTGLIVGMVICLFVAVGCGVAAILLFIDANKPDPVAIATERLITGNMPTNFVAEGSIDVEVNDMSSPISRAKITVNGEGMTKSMINSSRVMADMNVRNGGSFSIGLEEVYAANGDLYFKVDGIANVLNAPYLFSANTLEGEAESTEAAESEAAPSVEPTDAENCSSAENCLVAETTIGDKVLTAIDGVWIRASVDEVNAMFTEGTGEGNISCLANLITDVNENSNSIAEMYSRNPFVVSATGEVELTSKNDPVYKLSISEKKLAGFMNEAGNSTTIKNLSSCLGYEQSGLNAESLLTELQKLPEIFVEIDGNYNFTRVYFNTNLAEVDANLVADFSFSYPDTINVTEPVEYKDLSTLTEEPTSEEQKATP